jgi:hypothetical protein
VVDESDRISESGLGGAIDPSSVISHEEVAYDHRLDDFRSLVRI